MWKMTITYGAFDADEKNKKIKMPPSKSGEMGILKEEKLRKEAKEGLLQQYIEIVTGKHNCRQLAEKGDITRYGNDGQIILTDEAKQKMNQNKGKQQDEGR